jgi:hypothetical protein
MLMLFVEREGRIARRRAVPREIAQTSILPAVARGAPTHGAGPLAGAMHDEA